MTPDTSCGQPEPAPGAVQQALLDEAISLLDGGFDAGTALLVHPARKDFRAIRESLCYAGLLLARRSGAGGTQGADVERAGAIIDAVLATQGDSDSGHAGEFPLAWTADGKAGHLWQPDTRQTVGTVLGMILRRFRDVLGNPRGHYIRQALNRCARAQRAGDVPPGHLKMLHAWLDLEFGYAIGGERLAAKVAAEPELIRGLRVADPEALGHQLFAAGVWRSAPPLAALGKPLAAAVWRDLARWRHPDLGTLFGTGLAARGPAQPSDRLWHEVWVRWLELAEPRGDPFAGADPLHVAALALPVLAAPGCEQAFTDAAAAHPQGDAVAASVGDRELTGWFERDLHIEAAACRQRAPRALVAAAYWPTRSGLAQLRCTTSNTQMGRCHRRFVRLICPGRADIQITGLGPGESRMIEDGWWLAGLHIGIDGFRVNEACRTADGLRLRLQATMDEPMLLFAPLPG